MKWLIWVLGPVVVVVQLFSRMPFAQDYRALLRSGQRHAAAKQWEAAVSDLQAARKIKSDDAELLSELSYALFMAKHLSEAKLAAEQAIKFASTDNQKAASLYNLGRILLAEGEEQGNVDEERVVEAFEKSLQLRYSEETARRLLTVYDLTDATICKTPRSLASICECFANLPDGLCSLHEQPAHPEARIIQASWKMAVPSTGRSTLFLAIRFGDGWSVVENLGRERDSDPIYWYISDIKLKVGKNEAKRFAILSYTRSEEDVHCTQLSGKALGVKGLRDEVDVSCRTETKRIKHCSIDEHEHSASCIDRIAACKYTESMHIEEEVPARLRRQVKAILSKKNRSSKADLRIDNQGNFAGTEIEDGTCDAPQPIK